MKLLLDTHTFLWWDSNADKLPATLLTTLRDPSNELVLSVVSVWEMQIKAALGRLALRIPLVRLIEEQQARNGLGVLPVSLGHVLALEDLEDHHKDPFDRLLIAQAKQEGLTIVGKDEVFEQYDVAS